MSLFDRVATIIVQHPDHKDVVIQNLRISFDVEKFFDHTLNTGTITVYNLNPENRRLLVKRKADFESAPFTTISLIAGYRGAGAMIFRGSLVQGSSIRSGPNWITTLQCVSGFDQYITTHHLVNDSFEEINAFDLLVRLLGGGTPGEEFGENLVLGAALNMSFFETELLKKEIVTGTAYSGRVWETVKGLLARYNLIISIDDFEALIAREYEPVNPEDELTAPLLNQASGILGSPEVTAIGVQLSVLLNHEIKVVKLFRVQSETTKQNDLRGLEIQTYTCVKLTHSGDTHSDTWQSNITGAWFPELDFIGSKAGGPSGPNFPPWVAFPP